MKSVVQLQKKIKKIFVSHCTHKEKKKMASVRKDDDIDDDDDDDDEEEEEEKGAQEIKKKGRGVLSMKKEEELKNYLMKKQFIDLSRSDALVGASHKKKQRERSKRKEHDHLRIQRHKEAKKQEERKRNQEKQKVVIEGNGLQEFISYQPTRILKPLSSSKQHLKHHHQPLFQQRAQEEEEEEEQMDTLTRAILNVKLEGEMEDQSTSFSSSKTKRVRRSFNKPNKFSLHEFNKL